MNAKSPCSFQSKICCFEIRDEKAVDFCKSGSTLMKEVRNRNKLESVWLLRSCKNRLHLYCWERTHSWLIDELEVHAKFFDCFHIPGFDMISPRQVTNSSGQQLENSRFNSKTKCKTKQQKNGLKYRKGNRYQRSWWRNIEIVLRIEIAQRLTDKNKNCNYKLHKLIFVGYLPRPSCFEQVCQLKEDDFCIWNPIKFAIEC